jgi:uncharacterized protein
VRVFLDTNLLLSALAARGLCADLFQVLIAGHTIVVSEDVLVELERALVAKLRFPERLLKDTLVFLRESCEVVPASRALPLPGLDRADRVVVTGAIIAKVDALVTGDQAILAMQEAHGIPLLSPRGLWESLRKG